MDQFLLVLISPQRFIQLQASACIPEVIPQVVKRVDAIFAAAAEHAQGYMKEASKNFQKANVYHNEALAKEQKYKEMLDEMESNLEVDDRDLFVAEERFNRTCKEEQCDKSMILSSYILCYPMLSYVIQCYPMLSYVIQSYPILSYLILSYLTYPILTYPSIILSILSYPILSYPILPGPILSHPAQNTISFFFLKENLYFEHFGDKGLQQ